MGKPLTQMVPDFREALEEGVRTPAARGVRQLKIAGPYWTGFFEVALGRSMPAKKRLKPTSKIRSRFQSKKKRPVNTHRGLFPESPENLGGYTIGNRANTGFTRWTSCPVQAGCGQAILPPI